MQARYASPVCKPVARRIAPRHTFATAIEFPSRAYACRLRLLLTGSVATFRTVILPIPDVSDSVATLQVRRYRAMSPAEKLAQADALFDVAWDAVKVGVRMRHPDFDEAAVHHAARALFRRAAD